MEINSVVSALAALAQEHRLTAYRALVRAGSNGLAAGTLSTMLNIPASSLSFHLAALERAGLIDRRRSGRRQIYTAEFGAMNALVDFLTENCCGGEGGRCEIERSDAA